MREELASRAIEQKVLSYLLEYPEEQVEYLPRLSTSDFHYFQNTYELYQKIYDSDESLASPTIYSRGDESKVNDIMRTSVSPGEINSLVDNLKDLSNRRKLLSFTKQVEGAIQSKESIRNKVLDLENQFIDMTEGFYSSESLRPISEMIDSVKEHLEQLRQQNHLSGVDTGLSDLNSQTGGYQNGEYILIAARTSIGKTDLMLNSALKAAQTGKRTAIFSLEMSSTNLIKRLTAQVSGIDRQAIGSGAYNDHKAKRIKSALKKLSAFPLYIDDESHKIDEITYKIQRQVKQGEMDIAFIDYFGLIDTPDVDNGTIQNEKAKCSHRLKFLAKKIDIPIIVLAQLNRGAENTNQPKISHLRGTGALEQDCDMTLILTRPNLGSEVEIKIGKQRNGPTDTFKEIRYNQKTGVFSDGSLA